MYDPWNSCNMIPGILQSLISRKSKGTNDVLRSLFSKLTKSIFYHVLSSYFIETLQKVLSIKCTFQWPSTPGYDGRAMAKYARSSSNCTKRWKTRGMRWLCFLFRVIRSLFDFGRPSTFVHVHNVTSSFHTLRWNWNRKISLLFFQFSGAYRGKPRYLPYFFVKMWKFDRLYTTYFL